MLVCVCNACRRECKLSNETGRENEETPEKRLQGLKEIFSLFNFYLNNEKLVSIFYLSSSFFFLLPSVSTKCDSYLEKYVCREK